MPQPNQNQSSLFRIEPTLVGQQRECAAFARSKATSAFLLYSICAVVVVAAIYASQQQLARKSTVPGRVELIGGELKLYADSRRILSKLYVKDGDIVKQGQTIALLRRPDHNHSTRFQTQNAGQGFDALIASLKNDLQRLQNAKTNASSASAANRKNLLARRLNTQAILKSHAAERKTLNALASVTEEQLERGRELNLAGHLALTQLEELETRHGQNELKLSLNHRNSLALKEKLQGLDHELATLNLKLENQISNLEEAIGRSHRELTELQLSIEHKMVAPADGLITGVLSHSGATVDPDRPLITMVKNAARFRAKLWASSIAAGDLRLAQRVNLMLDAFPHQKHGMLEGIVAHINESPLTLRELDAPWEGAGPTYSLTVAIDHAQPLYSQLKPGMNLTADIKLDDSLLAERLFEPLIQAWQRTL